MMGSLQMQGSGESGYGLRLSGFYSPNSEAASRIAELTRDRTPARIGTSEENGYIMFLMAEVDQPFVQGEKCLAYYRREPSKFFPDLPAFLRKIRAGFVDQISLSQSLGSVTLVLSYWTDTLSEESTGV